VADAPHGGGCAGESGLAQDPGDGVGTGFGGLAVGPLTALLTSRSPSSPGAQGQPTSAVRDVDSG
jgi:hypothetical protein